MQAPLVAYVWIGILTFTTYTLAGHMREQVCLYMCPWPRIQAALTDEYALNVTYRYDRGEPRCSVKKAERCARRASRPATASTASNASHVCPTGVDIRDGANLGCIQCGLCIDACDAVMAKIGRAARLIAYDTDINIKRRQEGKPPFFKHRAPAHGALCRDHRRRRRHDDLHAGDARERGHQRHPRPQPDVRAAVGRRVRNGYTIRIVNKQLRAASFALGVDGLPAHDSTSSACRRATTAARWSTVGPDQTREVRVLVTDYSASRRRLRPPIVFRMIDVATGAAAERERPLLRAVRRKQRCRPIFQRWQRAPAADVTGRMVLVVAASRSSASSSPSMASWSAPRSRPSAASRRRAPTRPGCTSSRRSRRRSAQDALHWQVDGKLVRDRDGATHARRHRARCARARRWRA